jgi:hypothetical protein
MLTPADFLTDIECDACSSNSTYRPSSTQTFDFHGKPNDSDQDRD